MTHCFVCGKITQHPLMKLCSTHFQAWMRKPFPVPEPIQNSINTIKQNQENIYRQLDLLKDRVDELEGKKKK